MREKITRLSRERFEYELPKILCSEQKLEIEVETGRIVKGSFTLKNTEERYMKGLLYSSSHLLRLGESSFTGTEADIPYEFHAEDIRARDVIKGQISIVSSCGEMELPFEIRVTEKYAEASIGEIRDLFQFTNLAKMDWTQAVGIFKASDFKEIFLKKEVEQRNIYEGLIQSGKYNQAMEEFLVCIQKKEPITVSLERNSFQYEVKKQDITDTFVLQKNNWGFLDIKIEVNHDFVQLSKTRIGTEDFIGNSCEIQFEIKNEKMCAGKNYAVITLYSIYDKMEINIEVDKLVKRMERDYDEKKIKECEVILVNSYINFRSNRIAVGDYVKEMRETLTKLEQMLAVKRNLGELGYSRRLDLYQMHLYMIEGEKQKVQEIMDSLEQESHIMKKNTLVDYCGFLYLKALFRRNESELQLLLREIRACYNEHKEAWPILWFLLFLDEKYEQDPREKLQAIEEQFRMGCTSPILYYEVCNVFNQDHTLLKELTPCVVQAINMGIKLWLLKEEVAIQFAYLAEREKGFHRLIMSNLVTCYDKFQSKEILTAICSLLIKSDISDNSCFAWYEAGVKAQLRLTQLYEYYMYSIDEEYTDLLPQDVYLYFSYNTNLLEDKKAFLFANVVTHKEELPEVYPMYLDQMREYTRVQLQKRKIDKHMAVLYRTFVDDSMVTADLARDLPYVLFKQCVTCKQPGIVGVVVRHKESDEEVYTPFDKHGNAYVDIFTENAKVFLVDTTGRRYVNSIPWQIEKLMKRTLLAEVCFRYCPENRMVCMFLYERMDYYHSRNVQISQLQKYMDTDWLKVEYRKRWIMKLIQNYYDNYEGEALESLLVEIDLYGMRSSDRNLIIEYCIIRGLYDLAYEKIKEYSFEGVSVKRLRALCSKMIKKQGMEEGDPILAKLAFFVFKAGKYDENILRYLVRFYLGTTKDMFLIWKEAKEYDIESVDMEERLLGQSLFAESYLQDAMAVFLSFYENGKNRTLIKAFVSYYAYKYLVKDRVVDRAFFDIVKKELDIEENRSTVLALLKYYSTLQEWNEEERQFIETKVEQFISDGIIFPFFKKFAKKIKLIGGVEHMQFVEYKTNPNHKVVLHYLVEDEEMSDGFSEMEMTNLYNGIFVARFTLFHNETLQYYIEEIVEGQEPIITESIVHTGDAEMAMEEDEDPFSQINMMLIAREMKDEKTLLSMLRNYEKKEYVYKNAFHMLE